MAAFRISRKATTPKGFLKRVLDAGFEQVDDPRQQAFVVHPLDAMLRLGVLGLVSGARSSRAVEDRSEELRPTIRADIGLSERVSDNAFSQTLARLDPIAMRAPLHRQVKAEWGRKRLRPHRLPWSTVAFDGKHVLTLHDKELRALVARTTGLKAEAMEVEQLRRILQTQFPYIQLQDGERLVGLVRVHRATLISSQAAVVIDQWPIRGATNEHGTIAQSLRALLEVYGRTKMVEMVTMDAGNTSREVAELLRSRGVDYLMTIKSIQGRLHRLAVETLGAMGGAEAEVCLSHNERGKMVCYSVWTRPIEGDYGWQGARQLVRVERVVAGDDGEAQVGNRYFVTSKGADEMDAEAALAVARSHWRCENEGHWTADAIWREDARRTPWTRHPDGVLVVGLLRAMAINILAVLRALSRDDKGDKPSWRRAIEQALMVLCEPTVDMEDFNAVDG